MKKFYITPAIDIADLDTEATLDTLTPSSIPEETQTEDFCSKRAGSWDALDSWDTDDWSYTEDNDF